jgi:hypothetical protein
VLLEAFLRNKRPFTLYMVENIEQRSSRALGLMSRKGSETDQGEAGSPRGLVRRSELGLARGAPLIMM